MAAFKLPRLKANLAIVDGKGLPLAYFLRLFNIELAERIETTITDIAQVQDDLAAQQAALAAVVADQAAQLALIIAAQARADAAYALAESAQGSRYIDFSGLYPTISGIINGQSADSILTYFGSLSGATIDADTAWVGTIAFSEDDGGAPVPLGSVPVAITSNGLFVSGSWQTDDASFNFETTGTLSGNVTYTLTGAYTSGANLVSGPTISVNLTTLPRAA